MPQKTVSIRGGENAGRKIIYSNIVTFWEPLANWSGTGEITARTNISGAEPIVVLVQNANHGPIVASMVLR